MLTERSQAQSRLPGADPGGFLGIISAMRTTIDSTGRLVIPKEIRRQAALRPGMALDVRLRAGVTKVESAPIPVKLVRRGHVHTIVPQVSIDAMTIEEVQQLRVTAERDRGLG